MLFVLRIRCSASGGTIFGGSRKARPPQPPKMNGSMAVAY